MRKQLLCSDSLGTIRSVQGSRMGEMITEYSNCPTKRVSQMNCYNGSEVQQGLRL